MKVCSQQKYKFHEILEFFTFFWGKTGFLNRVIVWIAFQVWSNLEWRQSHLFGFWQRFFRFKLLTQNIKWKISPNFANGRNTWTIEIECFFIFLQNNFLYFLILSLVELVFAIFCSFFALFGICFRKKVSLHEEQTFFFQIIATRTHFGSLLASISSVIKTKSSEFV